VARNESSVVRRESFVPEKEEISKKAKDANSNHVKEESSAEKNENLVVRRESFAPEKEEISKKAKDANSNLVKEESSRRVKDANLNPVKEENSAENTEQDRVNLIRKEKEEKRVRRKIK
jgi:hypothetical protein